MKKQWMVGLVASCLATAGVSARAEAAIATMTSSFTDFKYELRSLDAEPVSAPTVTFQAVTVQSEPTQALINIDKAFGVLQTDANGTITDTATMVSGAPWATGSVQSTSSDGTLSASVTPTGLNTSGSFSAAYAASKLGSTNFDNGNIAVGAKAGIAQDADGIAFTLSPHSAITFTGLMQASMRLDTAALNEVSKAFYDGVRTPFVSVGAFNYINVASLPEDLSTMANWDTQEASLGVLEAFTYQPDVAGGLVVKSDEKAFSITVENTRDTALVGVFNLFTGTQTNWYRNTIGAPEISVTPSVPEPGTYALMGLGLMGLSVVARQRRLNNSH